MTEIPSGNIVVLIDAYTRKAVERITYDALSKHVVVVTDIRELRDEHYGNDFVFFEPAVPTVVTPENLKMAVEQYNIKPYLICGTTELGFLFSGVASVVEANYSVIEWNLIYAVTNTDLAILEPYLQMKCNIEEFSKLIESITPESASTVDKLYKSYLALARNYSDLMSAYSDLKDEENIYKSVGDKAAKSIQELKELLEEATGQNRTFCTMLSESYDIKFTGVYPDRPRVLYVKCISHVPGIDNLLMVLYSVLTKQYKVSCKIIKLVDQASASAIRYTPNVYFPLTDSYDTRDVLTNDFLMNLGAYNVLMDLLMLNRSGLDYLIVHDMRGTMGDALDNVLIDLKMHEVSSDYAVLGEYENIISDIERTSHFYWSFKDIAPYTGTSTSKLANHPTIVNILDYLM